MITINSIPKFEQVNRAELAMYKCTWFPYHALNPDISNAIINLHFHEILTGDEEDELLSGNNWNEDMDKVRSRVMKSLKLQRLSLISRQAKGIEFAWAATFSDGTGELRVVIFKTHTFETLGVAILIGGYWLESDAQKAFKTFERSMIGEKGTFAVYMQSPEVQKIDREIAFNNVIASKRRWWRMLDAKSGYTINDIMKKWTEIIITSTGGGSTTTHTRAKWVSSGRKITLKDGSKRALYKNSAKPGDLRIRRLATRAGHTVATYIKPPR